MRPAAELADNPISPAQDAARRYRLNFFNHRRLRLVARSLGTNTKPSATAALHQPVGDRDPFSPAAFAARLLIEATRVAGRVSVRFHVGFDSVQ